MRAIGTRNQRMLPWTAMPFGDPSYRNGPSMRADCSGPGISAPPLASIETAFTCRKSELAVRVPWTRSCSAAVCVRVTAMTSAYRSVEAWLVRTTASPSVERGDSLPVAASATDATAKIETNASSNDLRITDTTLRVAGRIRHPQC